MRRVEYDALYIFACYSLFSIGSVYLQTESRVAGGSKFSFSVTCVYRINKHPHACAFPSSVSPFSARFHRHLFAIIKRLVVEIAERVKKIVIAYTLHQSLLGIDRRVLLFLFFPLFSPLVS